MGTVNVPTPDSTQFCDQNFEKRKACRPREYAASLSVVINISEKAMPPAGETYEYFVARVRVASLLRYLEESKWRKLTFWYVLDTLAVLWVYLDRGIDERDIAVMLEPMGPPTEWTLDKIASIQKE